MAFISTLPPPAVLYISAYCLSYHWQPSHFPGLNNGCLCSSCSVYLFMCKVVYMFRSNNLGVHESIQLILTNCTCTDGSTTDQPSAVTPFPHIFFLVTYVLHKSVSCLIAEENGFHVLMHMFQRHPPRKLKVETQVMQASTARMKSSIMDPKHQRTQCDMQKSQTSIDI